MHNSFPWSECFILRLLKSASVWSVIQQLSVDRVILVKLPNFVKLPCFYLFKITERKWRCWSRCCCIYSLLYDRSDWHSRLGESWEREIKKIFSIIRKQYVFPCPIFSCTLKYSLEFNYTHLSSQQVES